MAEPTRDELALLVSEGLDLCVRAKGLDAAIEKAAAVSSMTGTRCLTPALWVQDQYDRDLNTWEGAARTMLSRLPQFQAPPSPRTTP